MLHQWNVCFTCSKNSVMAQCTEVTTHYQIKTVHSSEALSAPLSQINIIEAMVIVWRVRGKIIRSVLCNIVCNYRFLHYRPNLKRHAITSGSRDNGSTSVYTADFVHIYNGRCMKCNQQWQRWVHHSSSVTAQWVNQSKSAQQCTTRGHPIPLPQVTSGSVQ